VAGVKGARSVATALTFTYTADGATDYLSQGMKADYTALSNTLAVDDTATPSAVFIHGSSNIAVKQGTTDVSDLFSVFRMKRVWTRPVSPNPVAGDPMGGPTGPYGQGDRRLLPDSLQKPAGAWTDTVGWDNKQRWSGYERSLHEFAVGADDPITRKVRDESGGIYMVVVIDLSPEWYRIRMSQAIVLTAAQWKAARGIGGASPIPTGQPFKTDAAGSIAWAWNSDWESWGTYNNQLPLP
jgi:hypothetical protein